LSATKGVLATWFLGYTADPPRGMARMGAARAGRECPTAHDGPERSRSEASGLRRAGV